MGREPEDPQKHLRDAAPGNPQKHLRDAAPGNPQKHLRDAAPGNPQKHPHDAIPGSHQKQNAECDMKAFIQKGARFFIALFFGLLVLPSTCLLTGCAFKGAAHEVTVAGSTTVLPIAEIASEKIQEKQGINALVSGLGSSAGIEAVMNGTADIATSSRDLTTDEAAAGILQKTIIAHDGIAVIVNPDNPVSALSLVQLRGIFAGQITNWHELGGPNEAILVVNRDEASGTREAFKSIVMQGDSFDRHAAVLPGTGQVRDVVSRTKNAIGYISLGFVNSEFSKEKVKTVAIDGVAPSEQSIQGKTYPIARDLFFFTRGAPTGDAASFVNFVLSDEMDSTIREAGYLPLFPFEKEAEEGNLS